MKRGRQRSLSLPGRYGCVKGLGPGTRFEYQVTPILIVPSSRFLLPVVE